MTRSWLLLLALLVVVAALSLATPLDSLIELARRTGMTVRNVRVREPELEEVFVELAR